LFRLILVPADLTNKNRAAVEMAAGLVNAQGGAVHLLHVIETIPGFTLEEEKGFYARLEKAAARHLEALARPLQEAGLRWEADVVYGPRAKTILDEAERLGADLIVVRSHRVHPKRRQQSFGTLSHQVGIFARCPVLLVK
jgi:nucleotide-binding universal stress UspA family protein